MMKRNYINKATGVGFDLDTLLQGVTNTVGHVTTAIVNGLQVTERTKQIRAFFNLKETELYNEREKDRYGYLSDLTKNAKSNDTGYYFMLFIIFAMLAGGVYFAVKVSKKNK